ncbi:hypothetical protein EmuJ_000371000 [Echinococcus multilocularis]|uniref:Uncharacterized protein n=1 Tax=Echinococcus multilocularis TaxID=6211 RepID=A0A068XWG0_ECHMU|nr:hypothetical protein EmuJ_000371000 [Echinococcus multilocularis]
MAWLVDNCSQVQVPGEVNVSGGDEEALRLMSSAKEALITMSRVNPCSSTTKRWCRLVTREDEMNVGEEPNRKNTIVPPHNVRTDVGDNEDDTPLVACDHLLEER